MAGWLSRTFGVDAFSLRDLGLRDAADTEIFQAARREAVVVISKDSDFVDLVSRDGPPPALLWVTCGNVSNRQLEIVFARAFPQAVELLAAGQAIVEIA